MPGYALWSRFSIEVGESVVRIGGILVLHSYPTNDELLPLVEGRDYFLGGHTYTITTATGNELIAAGFDVDMTPTPPTDDEDPPGYGEGGYGEGGYGT